jgi:hypothetical protein
MTIDQIIAVYKVLAHTGRGRAVSAVSKETGVPKADVERFVTFIKSSPFFHFELTESGLLSNLTIRTVVPGAYTHSYNGQADIFYKDGEVVQSVSDAKAYDSVSVLSKQMAAEAQAAGVPFYQTYSTPAINTLAPFLVKWLAA